MNSNHTPDAGLRMQPWRDSAAKRLVAAATLPLFYLLNRPSLAWLARASYDFALRCNGFAINFKGRHGLSVGEENFLRRHFSSQHHKSRPAGVLFDVGANHGTYTRYLRQLAPDARIYAFEPHPTSFAALTRDAAGPGTVLVNQALSDAPGQTTLYDFADQDGSTQASLSKGAVGLFTGDVVEHAITCTTLDAFIAEAGITHIDLLKVDTEGFDLAVFRGARQALADGRIGVIQFEFIPANIITGTRMRDFMELLANHRIHRICLNGSLLPLEPYDVKRCEVYAMQNLIALPR